MYELIKVGFIASKSLLFLTLLLPELLLCTIILILQLFNLCQFTFLFGNLHHYFFYITLLLLKNFLNFHNKIPKPHKAHLISLLFHPKAILFLLFHSLLNFINDFILQTHRIIQLYRHEITACLIWIFEKFSNAK